MRIGIVVSAQQSSGGIFQYTQSILSALVSWDSNHEFVILVWKGNPLPWNQYSGPRWRVEAMDPSIATQPQDVQAKLGPEGIDLLEAGVNRRAALFFRGLEIDLLIFPAPAALAFECGIPYLMAIHDLQHRLQPEFPEVSNGGVWQRREYLFRNGVRFARGILVDSEVGKEDVLKCFGEQISSDRLHVLPFLPGQQIESGVTEAKKVAVRQKYGLPERFFFYPAQFWLHKNHSRLIHAIHILRAAYQIDAPLVLAGSNSGGPVEEGRELVFKNALGLAKQLGVEDLIHYLGYVADDEMAPLYSQAAGLAMPTFFGPTNIPVLEAWALGCPVLTSDIRGIREQVGEAGVLVNPRDADAIAKGLITLWKDAAASNRCVEAGRRRLANYTSRDFSQRLVSMISNMNSSPLRTMTASQGNAQSEQLRGFQYFEQGQWEDALACFDRVVAQEPQRQGLNHLRAKCFFQLERWKDCERAIFAELKIQPNHPDTRGLLRELRQLKPVGA